jgi:ABC-type phosphate/phosphonate transport system substrate-binding protein
MRPRGTIGFGLARALDFHASLGQMAELCELLSKEVGAVFYPHHALSYRELAAGLERSELGLAWTPPITAIEILDAKLATLLVTPVRRGSTLYHSALLVRPGGASTILDVKGKRVAWVDRESATGHLVPKMHLATLGFDPQTFFAQEIYAGSHIGVIEALFTGRVDVCATFCKLDGGGRPISGGWTGGDGKAVHPVEVLATIGPVPNDAIMAASSLDSVLRARILRWFLDPPVARAKQLLADLVRAESCLAVTPSHYEPLRRLMQQSAARGVTPWRRASTSMLPPRM